jgi:hypothetical protein
MATQTLPGLVNKLGPGKQNFVNTLQTLPWQGGGVAGGGQAHTNHGNWFQSMNPFSTNTYGSVILEKNFIPGESNPFTSGSALKNKKAKGKRGYGVGGPTYDLPPKTDMMDISGSSLVASDYADRDRRFNTWLMTRERDDPDSDTLPPSIVQKSSSSNNDVNMEPAPEVDETAELINNGLNIDTSNLPQSPTQSYTSVDENLSPSGPALSTEAINSLPNNFQNLLPIVKSKVGYGLNDSPSPPSSPEIVAGPSNQTPRYRKNKK